MLYIHCFGHLRLFEDRQPVRFSALPKSLSILAYLLLHRADATPRDQLAYTLWPDVLESEARSNLRRHLHDLRRALPPAPRERPFIVADTRYVEWNPESEAWLDVAEFERLSAELNRRTEAIAIYTGDLLPRLYHSFAPYKTSPAAFRTKRVLRAWLSARLMRNSAQRIHLTVAVERVVARTALAHLRRPIV